MLHAVLEPGNFWHTNISQGRWQHVYGVVGSLLIILTQISRGICQWKNFENRLRFDRVTAMSLASSFLEHSVESFYHVISAHIFVQQYMIRHH